MKRWVIFVLILLISMSYALEDRLVIRVHTPSEITINLYQHLPPQEGYFINHSENVKVRVEGGTAVITPLTSFKGSETVIFAVNESALVEKEELYEASKVVNITQLIEEYPKIISSAKTSEVFNETLNLVPLLKNIKEKPIEKIYSKILEDHLFVIINDEVEINISLKEDIPSYSIQLISNQGQLDESALKLNVRKPILIALSIIVLALVLFAIKKATEGMKLKRIKPHRSIGISLNKTSKMPKATASAHVLYLTEKFFKDKFEIGSGSSTGDLENRLNKEKIRGNTKQEILFLFNKIKEGALSEHETELAKRYLKKALKNIQ